MHDREITSRLGHGLRMRQLKLGIRMNCLILRDGLGDKRLTAGSAAGFAAGSVVGEGCSTRGQSSSKVGEGDAGNSYIKRFLFICLLSYSIF